MCKLYYDDTGNSITNDFNKNESGFCSFLIM